MSQGINKKNCKNLWLLAGWPVYFIMYFVTENFIPLERCHVVHSAVDDLIPFNEYFVFGYCFWYVLLAGSLLYFMLTDMDSFAGLQKYIITTQIIAVLVYIIWPSVQELRPETFTNDNFCTRLLTLIYAADTPTGVLPSCHVAFSLGIASARLKKKDAKRGMKIFVVISVIFICLSVMFIKQHSFYDVLAAVPVGLIAEYFAYGKTYYGDRRDGKLLRNLDSMHYIMPLMYPNRCDNEAYITMDIDLEKTEKYIKEKNQNLPREEQYTLFGLVIAASLMTIDKRPQMNRFIANNNVYERNHINAAFTVKKDLSDEGEESLARIDYNRGDTLHDIQKRVNEQIRFCKTHDDQSTESMNFIQKLPFKHFIGAAARFADRHGWMPASVIATDPYQCSVVLTNLGSIGMGIGYHHLMNWGTCSIFIVIGRKKHKASYDRDGNAAMSKVLNLSFTIDERIADGAYYGKSLRVMKRLLENPALMEGEERQEASAEND